MGSESGGEAIIGPSSGGAPPPPAPPASAAGEEGLLGRELTIPYTDAEIVASWASLPAGRVQGIIANLSGQAFDRVNRVLGASNGALRRSLSGPGGVHVLNAVSDRLAQTSYRSQNDQQPTRVNRRRGPSLGL